MDYVAASAKQGKDLSSSQKNRNEKAKGRTIKIILKVSILFTLSTILTYRNIFLL